MKRIALMGLAAALFIACFFASPSKETVLPFVEMEVKGVRADATGQGLVVVLSDKNEERALPIWIGILEAGAIERELKNVTSPRPMTHDLLHSILGEVHAKAKEVRIFDLKDRTYYAKLLLTVDHRVVEIDARPSDAIILALKSKCPILVSTVILSEQGISVSRKSAMGERQGIRIQELTPSLANHFNFTKKGVLVSEVIPGGVSEESGLKAGDIITKIDANDVGGVQEFEEIFDSIKPGSPIHLTFFRDNKLQEIKLNAKP